MRQRPAFAQPAHTLGRPVASRPPKRWPRVVGALLLGGGLWWAGQAPARAADAPLAGQGLQPAAHVHKMGEHPHPGPMAMLGGRHLERLLDEVKASDAQRQQIHQIRDAAQADLRALHAQAQAQRSDPLALLAQPQIDAAEAEKQRQRMLAQHDLVSKRMLQAMLDVAKVLTPEQRAQVAKQLQQRRERMAEHHKDRQGKEPSRPDHGRRAGPDGAPAHQ